jgi:uncharacterized membrane protein YfcA
MPDLPNFPAVMAIISEPRFAAAMAVAIISGLVRGFSGFGSALIYIPLISAVYGPRVAVPTLLLIDTLCSLPWTYSAVPQANWRELTPVTIAGMLTLPLGVALLIYVDPLPLRWFISALVGLALIVLITGWRYHGRPTLLASLATGVASGIGGGSVQIAAPPLLVLWLGGQNSAATVRANIMTYFLFSGTLSIIAYAYTGLFTVQNVTLALLFGIPFAVALGIGARWFHGSSDLLYRRVAYIIIAAAGLISLPLFDGLR